jgi:hypothetical protein
MSQRFFTSVALAAVLASTTGCFSIIGATVGGLSDNSHAPRSRHRQTAPRSLGAPGAASEPFYFDPDLRAASAQEHHVDAPEEPDDDDSGMSPAVKGFLGGAALDLVLGGLALYMASQIDFYGSVCDDGCHGF